MSDYDAIYSQDNPEGDAHGWIQWKGTNVCMDLYCKCGHHGHFDGWFFYNFECPQCHTKYAVGQNVRLIELTVGQIANVEKGIGFKTCELDED